MKVVINKRVGGFRPSQSAIMSYFYKKGFAQISKLDENIENQVLYYRDPNDSSKKNLCYRNIVRHDPIFVEIVESLGEFANTHVCELKIVDIPDGVDYIICENESGVEWIAEKHRSWA